VSPLISIICDFHTSGYTFEDYQLTTHLWLIATGILLRAFKQKPGPLFMGQKHRKSSVKLCLSPIEIVIDFVFFLKENGALTLSLILRAYLPLMSLTTWYYPFVFQPLQGPLMHFLAKLEEKYVAVPYTDSF
jgi:hypothetical protein